MYKVKWHWPILTTENRKKLILRQKLGDLHYFTWNILEYSIFYSWIKIVTLYIETTEAWIVLNNLNLFCKELEFYYKIAFFKYSFIIQFCMALYWEDNFKRLLTKKKSLEDLHARFSLSLLSLSLRSFTWTKVL